MGNQRRRRRGFANGDPLGELTEAISEERSLDGKRVLDPGSMFVTDWINRNTLSLFPFTIGIAARRILPANPLRTYLIVQNKSGGTIFINFGQNPSGSARFCKRRSAWRIDRGN